jgi:hypothetical protein
MTALAQTGPLVADLLPVALISFALGAAVGFERTRRRSHSLHAGTERGLRGRLRRRRRQPR